MCISKKKFYVAAMTMLMLVTSCVSCSDDDENKIKKEEELPVEECGYDIVVSLGEHGGMNQGEGTVVRRVSSLEAGQPMIDFNNKGVVLTGEYTMEAIVKGKYYYQIPESADRFVKFMITSDNLPPTVVATRMFKTNTYKQRSYTHAWLDDNTLLIMAANGDRTQILWTKLNAEDLAIIDEGVIEGIEPSENAAYGLTTSGILTYRKADGKLFYFYQEKKSARVTIPYFYTAVIDPQTMKIEGTPKQTMLAEEMAGSAYGELMQNTVMYDEQDNLYLACLSASDVAGDDGILLRIKAGETDFDAEYNGYKDPDGKLLTLQYLGGNKAFVYSRNDRIPNPENQSKYLSGVSDYIHYYSILDLVTGERKRIQYQGEDLPLCAGRFAQRSVVHNGKVYFGITAREYPNPCIYIYDISTGTVSKGAEISEGFYFDMIRLIEE